MTSATQRPRLIWRLVEESLSESAFLWTRLDRGLDTLDHTLVDVERWVERRLMGALDGVRLAGSAAISPLLSEALIDSDPGFVGTAAYLLATLGSAAAIDALEDGLRQISEEHVSTVTRGLGRAGNVVVLQSLWARVQDCSSIGRACLIDALAFCRATPEANWASVLASDLAAERRAAASALAFLEPSMRTEVMGIALQSPDREVRQRANIASLLAGDGAAWRRCCEAVRAADPEITYAAAMLVVAMLGTGSEQAHLCKALAVPALKRDALGALSFAGSCDAVDACVTEALTGQERDLACQAIVAITGIDLSKLPAAASSQPTNPSSSSEIEPDLSALERWWHSERQRLDPNARYQHGRLKTLTTLRAALSHGPTRHRHAIAAELAVRTRGTCRIQTWALCSEQRRQLPQLDALGSRELRDAVSALGIEPIAEA